MGSGGRKKPMSEIAETIAAGREDAFETILDRIETEGEITSDETSPLYTDIGMQEFEVGSERIVEYTLNKKDFRLIRKSETHRLSGDGHQKTLSELQTPRVNMALKMRMGYTDNWQNIDLDLLG